MGKLWDNVDTTYNLTNIPVAAEQGIHNVWNDGSNNYYALWYTGNKLRVVKMANDWSSVVSNTDLSITAFDTETAPAFGSGPALATYMSFLYKTGATIKIALCSLSAGSWTLINGSAYTITPTYTTIIASHPFWGNLDYPHFAVYTTDGTNYAVDFYWLNPATTLNHSTVVLSGCTGMGLGSELYSMVGYIFPAKKTGTTSLYIYVSQNTALTTATCPQDWGTYTPANSYFMGGTSADCCLCSPTFFWYTYTLNYASATWYSIPVPSTGLSQTLINDTFNGEGYGNDPSGWTCVHWV